MLPLFFFFLAEIRFEKTLQLQPPEEKGVFIQNPRWAALHTESGRTYVLDQTAKVVYVWDRDGRFLQAFGEPGAGPGQLEIRHESQGHLAIIGDHVCVYDGMADKLHYFDVDGNFVKTVRFAGHEGQDRFFRTTKSGHVLISKLTPFREEGPRRVTKLYNGDLKPVADLPDFEERSWALSPAKEGRAIWRWNPVADILVLHVGADSDQIIYGTGEPWFDIYDLTGKRLRRIEIELPLRPLSDAVQSRYDTLAAENPVVVERAPGDHYPRFSQILPYEDKGYLVLGFTIDSRLQGIFVDPDGKTLGEVDIAFGERGGIDCLNGRLVRSIVDDVGDFDCAYIAPVL